CWVCSQGVDLFPGNFFLVLLRGFGISLASEAQSEPLIGSRPRFSRGLHSVGPVASVAFLGYIISAVGIFHGPSEGFGGSAVASSQWSSVHQRFLGFASYYRKFIRNFSTLAK
ncbi:unnamed protein product, partial [Staurois parvus]